MTARTDSGSDQPQNPLHERYASREMAAIFSSSHRFATWRRIWILLAESEAELGLPIRAEQIAALEAAAPQLDLARVAEIERQTRHDVVAHLRHFAEQADAIDKGAGGILHLGATSAFITDNTDQLLMREALELLRRRIATALGGLAGFRPAAPGPALSRLHPLPAGAADDGRQARLPLGAGPRPRPRRDRAPAGDRCAAAGVKGTTGTQASFLTLFAGDHGKVRELDARVAAGLGFAGSVPVSGQTYTRKLDSQLLATLSGVAESCHKMGTDLRLLQGVGELAEPFDEHQVGSSAMAYKRNPVRAERMCGLARRIMTDALNGPINTATQWLERSLDDSANRRLVLPDAFLCLRRDPRPRRAHRRRAARERRHGRGAGRPRAAVHGHRDAAHGGGAARRRPPGAPRAHPHALVRGPGSGRPGAGKPAPCYNCR